MTSSTAAGQGGTATRTKCQYTRYAKYNAAIANDLKEHNTYLDNATGAIRNSPKRISQINNGEGPKLASEHKVKL